MVQREVADRFFAVPSTKAYGAVSVLIQLATVRTGFHPVSRSVFRPPPNVDSALVAFRRTTLPPDFAGLRKVVEGAFAHRRKTLANSLQLAGVATREQAVAGLTALGLDPAARAESLAPPFSSIWHGCSGEPASGTREDQPRARRRRAERDGKHEVVTVLQRISLADTVALSAGERLSVSGFADDTIVTEALRALAAVAGVEPGWAVEIEKAVPVAAGLGGGSSDAAAALRLANDLLLEPFSAVRSRRARRHDRRRRAVLPEPGHSWQRRRHRPRARRPAERLLDRRWCSRRVWSRARPVRSTAPSTSETVPGLRGAAGGAARGARDGPAPAGPRRAPSERSRVVARLRSACARLGAFRADVSGAGPCVYGLFGDRATRPRQQPRRWLRRGRPGSPRRWGTPTRRVWLRLL